MRSAIRFALPAAGTLALILTGTALAQDRVGPLLNDRQDPDEVRTTQALNAEVVAQNDLAASQESSDQQAYAAADAQGAAQADVDVSADRARHEADQAAYAEAQARYEAAMADWRATAAACQRGDTRRCRAGRQPAIPVGY